MRATLTYGVLFVLTWPAASALAADAPAPAGPKVTYVDHVLPVFKNACLNCHNPDKKKGNLDLSTYTGVAAGGSEKVIQPGDPDSSKLFKVVTWAEEPNMPPKGDKLSEKDLLTIRQWIAAGAPETSGSKVVVSKPKVDLATVAVTGKPTGPVAFPKDLPLEPVAVARRAAAATALASSPWAPLLAVGGHRQVVLFHSESLALLGVLSFPEGNPRVLKFSRNGSILLVGGGLGAKAGKVVLFDVATGNRVTEVGEEYDEVVAADISPDQAYVALGTPLRTLKVYATADGQLKHTIKKHTDWVTAIAYSPDGKFFASGDRAGGLFVWEAATAREYHNLTGHKEGVTDCAFRGDSNILASASSDGTIKLWNMEDGKAIRSVTAHAGGVLALSYAHDGRLASCGRDNVVKLWGPDGASLKSFDKFDDLAMKVTFNHDGSRVVGADFTGAVRVWGTADAKKVGELTCNPPTAAQRLAGLDARLKDLRAALDKAAAEHAAARAAADKARSDHKAAQAADGAGKTAVETAQAKLAAEVAKAGAADTLKAAEAAAEGYAKAKAAVATATEAVQALKSKLRADEAALPELTQSAQRAKARAAAAPANKDLAATAAQRAKAVTEKTNEVQALKKSLPAKSQEVERLTAAAAKAKQAHAAADAALAKGAPKVASAREAVAGARAASAAATAAVAKQADAIKAADEKLASAKAGEKAAADALAGAEAEGPRLRVAVAKSALDKARADLAARQGELARVAGAAKAAKSPAEQATLQRQADAAAKAVGAAKGKADAAQAEYDRVAKDVASSTPARPGTPRS